MQRVQNERTCCLFEDLTTFAFIHDDEVVGSCVDHVLRFDPLLDLDLVRQIVQEEILWLMRSRYKDEEFSLVDLVVGDRDPHVHLGLSDVPASLPYAPVALLLLCALLPHSLATSAYLVVLLVRERLEIDLREADLEVTNVDSREVVRPVAILELHFVVLLTEDGVTLPFLLETFFLSREHSQSKLCLFVFPEEVMGHARLWPEADLLEALIRLLDHYRNIQPVHDNKPLDDSKNPRLLVWLLGHGDRGRHFDFVVTLSVGVLGLRLLSHRQNTVRARVLQVNRL